MSDKDSHAEFHDKQSKELREKYRKKKEGSCTTNIDTLAEDDQNPHKVKAQRILIIILIIYGIILVTFVILLYQIKEFRYYCYGMLESINNSGPYLGATLIGLVGYWFVLTGFNVVLFDIMAGFLIRPFWFALTVVSIAKYLAKYTGFLCGRYWVRNFIYTAMNDNIYFIVCYLATERKPVKVMFLLQFLGIPTIFKTYACGLFRISHWDYLGPTLFGTVVWCAFWVYLGSKLESIAETLSSGDTAQYMPFWLKITLAIIMIIVIIYFFKLTNSIFKEIQSDASLAELSHILEKEEEEEKLLHHSIDSEKHIIKQELNL